MEFIVSITDPVQLDGITWAREQHNTALVTPPVEGEDPPPLPEGYCETDDEYVQWVMAQAAISYSDQKLRQEYQQEYETAVMARQGEGTNAT